MASSAQNVSKHYEQPEWNNVFPLSHSCAIKLIKAQNSVRSVRSHTKKTNSYNEDDCDKEFLQSDNEGSDFEQSDSNDDRNEEECEFHEAEVEDLKPHDKKLDNDCWVGHHIVKSFDQHEDSDGIVYNVDQASHRNFCTM